MAFADVASEVYGLYGDGRFREALGVVAEARKTYVSEDATLTFWQACLLSAGGDADRALAVLETGIRRGLWWSGAMLADADLDSARTRGGWRGLLSECDRRAQQATDNRPSVSVRPSTAGAAAGVLITLHGAGADPAEHAQTWETAAPGDWMVITPVGTVPWTVDRWSWPGDASSSRAVLDQLPGLDWSHPVVFGGFSQGAGVAASIARNPPGPLTGLLLAAPALPAQVRDSVLTLQCPTYFLVGDEDRGLSAVVDIADAMAAQGIPAVLDQRDGLGHAMPNDFSTTLPDALAWIISTQDR